MVATMPDARLGERSGHSAGNLHQDPLRGPETALTGLDTPQLQIIASVSLQVHDGSEELIYLIGRMTL